jgi:hypothetical protein
VRFLEGADGAAHRAVEDPVHLEFGAGGDEPLLRPDDEVAFGADLQQRVFGFRLEVRDLASAGARAERRPLAFGRLLPVPPARRCAVTRREFRCI